MLFVAPLSFVISWCLVVAAGVTAVTVFTDRQAGGRQKSVAAVGVAGCALAFGLTVLPFVLQD